MHPGCFLLFELVTYACIHLALLSSLGRTYAFPTRNHYNTTTIHDTDDDEQFSSSIQALLLQGHPCVHAEQAQTCLRGVFHRGILPSGMYTHCNSAVSDTSTYVRVLKARVVDVSSYSGFGLWYGSTTGSIYDRVDLQCSDLVASERKKEKATGSTQN